MKFTTSLFSQIIHITPRHSFARLANECGAERHAKGFSSLDQFVLMTPSILRPNCLIPN